MNGFGNQDISVQDLYKALTTNNYAQMGGPLAQTGGAAFIPESLESTLRTLTFTEQHLKLWKDIPKIKAYSTVEEHNIINNYGEDLSAFQREGIAGINTTGDYRRAAAKVKCINTTREVTHLMELVKTTENPIALETQSGMRYLLGQTERALFYGDSSLAPKGEEGLEWDGIFKQAEAANTIDLRGKHLSDVELNKASETILNNYGTPTKLYAPIPVTSVFSEQYYPDQRALMNVQAGTVTAGTMVTQFNSVGGTVTIEPDVFMRKGLERLDPTAPSYGLQAPTPPELGVARDAAVAAQTFDNGSYKYAVVAYSDLGKSVAVVSDAVAVTAADNTQAVKLTITNAAAQLYPAQYFTVYRTEANGDDFYEIGRIGVESINASAATVFVDDNSVLPNTGIAIVGDFRQEAIAFKQLSDMFKLDYAITAPVKRFGIFLYGMPVVYMPKRFVTIKNIKVVR